jgi:threonine dehydratase
VTMLDLNDYLKRILRARVYDVAVESPLQPAGELSRRLDNQVLLKREDQQAVFSFKLRGAYNKIAQLSPEQLRRGVICASAGNHAQGVALAARRLGATAVIVMPVTAPQVKIEAVKGLGGTVVLHGESYTEAYAHALEIQEADGLTFVHPFDDPDVIAGQGTVGMEILRQHQGPLDAIFVPVGGGGLIAGVAAYVKAVRPEIRVIGVQTVDSDAMARSALARERVTLQEVGLFSDGTAVKHVGTETFRIASSLVDDYVTVDTDSICAAIKDVYTDTRSIVEPSGALAMAAVKQYVKRRRTSGETYVVVLSGANMNFDRLRFVAERAEIGEEREGLLAVTIPESPGSLMGLCKSIGDLPGPPRNITELKYRVCDSETASVLVGVTIHSAGEAARVAEELTQSGFAAHDLTGDELAKEHMRHMVGGRSPLAAGERVLQFVFPERPGALMRFLSLLLPAWNITMFHYRNQGADYGRVLVGLQASDAEEAAFRRVVDAVGYAYEELTTTPSYRLFLSPHSKVCNSRAA